MNCKNIKLVRISGPDSIWPCAIAWPRGSENAAAILFQEVVRELLGNQDR